MCVSRNRIELAIASSRISWEIRAKRSLSCTHADERTGHRDCITTCMDMAKMVGVVWVKNTHNTTNFLLKSITTSNLHVHGRSLFVVIGGC